MIKRVLMITAMLMSQPLLAATLNCTGKVDEIITYYHNGVNIKPSWNASNVKVCTLNATWNSITPEMCQAWFTALQTAEYLQKDVLIQYDTTVTTCAAIPAGGSAPAPFMIKFLK